jgi:hypothetical protein
LALVQRVGGDEVVHEAAVDGVVALHGGLDEGLKGELVDTAGLAVGGVEELLDGVGREELGGSTPARSRWNAT